MTVVTIPDSPKTTIVIDSEENHTMTPMEPILAPTGLQIAAESSRTFTQEQPPTSMKHINSDDERLANKDEASHASPTSTYSTAPSEMPPTAGQNASPISSLDTDDIE